MLDTFESFVRELHIHEHILTENKDKIIQDIEVFRVDSLRKEPEDTVLLLKDYKVWTGNDFVPQLISIFMDRQKQEHDDDQQNSVVDEQQNHPNA